MKVTDKDNIKLEFSDKLKARALELLDESHAMQFAEGLRLNKAAALVFDREQRRLEKKYGKEDQRTMDMVIRAETSATLKADLFSRYTDAITPPTKPKEGWAVDGFVREPDGRGLEGLTVAAYDKQETRLKEFGQATTDERGFFSITVEKLPEKPPNQVIMRAAKGKTLLPSNEVTVSPEPGGVERIEIIVRLKEKEPKPVDDTLPGKPSDKPADGGTTKQPDKPADGVTLKPTEKPVDRVVLKPVEKIVLTKDKSTVSSTRAPALSVESFAAAEESTPVKRKSSAGSKTKAKPAKKRSTKKRSK